MDDATLRQNIIKEFQLEQLDENAQNEVLEKMTESLIKRTLVNALERLSEEEISEFEKIQESDNGEEIEKFLRAKISDYDQLLLDSIAEFKAEFKQAIG